MIQPFAAIILNCMGTAHIVPWRVPGGRSLKVQFPAVESAFSPNDQHTISEVFDIRKLFRRGNRILGSGRLLSLLGYVARRGDSDRPRYQREGGSEHLI